MYSLLIKCLSYKIYRNLRNIIDKTIKYIMPYNKYIISLLIYSLPIPHIQYTNYT